MLGYGRGPGAFMIAQLLPLCGSDGNVNRPVSIANATDANREEVWPGPQPVIRSGACPNYHACKYWVVIKASLYTLPTVH